MRPIEQQLIDRFMDALRKLPEVGAGLKLCASREKHTGDSYDAIVDLHAAGGLFTLLVETRKDVFPRDARQAIWQFREVSAELPTGTETTLVRVLIAESISPGARELLRNESIGYYDTGGSLYLPAPGAYFHIDKPPPKALVKSMRTLFSHRRTQVHHALLVQPQRWFGVTDLARQAMVSPATASQVLTELERFDWLDVRGKGPNKERRLGQPAALLNAWSNQPMRIRQPAMHRYYVSSTPANTLLNRIGQVFNAHGVEYAISHEAAAQYYSPFLSVVSQIRIRVMVGEAAIAATDALGARTVVEGSNLVILDVASLGELLFRERVGELWLASPIQIYLDLLSGEGRSGEMAEHFRSEKIGF